MVLSKLAFAALIVLSSAALAVPFEMDERGVVRLGGSAEGVTVVVSMHTPGWGYASMQSGNAETSRDGNSVAGRVLLPKPGVGAMEYSVRATPGDGACEFSYSVGFSEETEIQGAYVSIFLPGKRFQGREVCAWPSETRVPLPEGQGNPELGGVAAGVSVDVGNGQSLLFMSSDTGTVLCQNHRMFTNDSFELRLGLWNTGAAPGGMPVRRTFQVMLASHDAVKRKATTVNQASTFDSEKPFALLHKQGHVSVRRGRTGLLGVKLAVHGLNWAYAEQAAAEATGSGSREQRFVQGKLAVPDGVGRLVYVQQASATDDGGMRLAYDLRFDQNVAINGYQTAFTARLEHYVGRDVSVTTPEGEKRVHIGEEHGGDFLFEGEVTAVSVAAGSVPGFSISVETPTHLLIQDNRGWGGSTVELRFCHLRAEDGGRVEGNTPIRRDYTLKLTEPLQVVLDQNATALRTDTSTWIPFTLPWDSAPVDVSSLNHKPAGKHGFVTAKGGKFILADTGEEIRFWGTCFSAGANFPSHEQSEKIAARLAKFGINMVRPHHADAPWAERHFFPKSVDNTRVFDEENLDRFDYLVHCLKQEGIYLYLDQLVHRRFKTGDGVDAVSDLPAAAKPYSNFDPKLIELQKEFSKNIWEHVNPYTKLAYKDDPAVALMEFANENDMFTQKVTLEPYRTRLEARYRTWASEKGISLPDGDVDFAVTTDPMMRFFIDVQKGFYDEMEQYLRENVGVRVPMTGSNWSRNAALLLALRDCDFTDSHAYWQHPGKDGTIGNRPMVGSSRTIMDSLGFQSVPGKPFFVSEWDEPWPNEWRAELPVWMAAVAAFQGWNGLTVYTYRHSVRLPINSITGAFETFNDPARFGLFPHAALAYRRGDFRTGSETWVHIPPELAESAKSPSSYSGSAYQSLAMRRRFRTAVADGPFARETLAHDADGKSVSVQSVAPDQSFRHDPKAQILALSSPRTQVVSGFIRDAGEQTTGNMTVSSGTVFATIALSSLDGDPIERSASLLLTAVGRAENTGFAFDVTRTKRLAGGSGPILIDPVRATVRIKTGRKDLAVIPVGADGTRGNALSAHVSDGWLTFEIGPESRTIYYAIGASR